MEHLINTLIAWGIPNVIVITLIGVFIIMQLIGEIIELFGKTAPYILKLRNYFKDKKAEKLAREARDLEVVNTLKELQKDQTEVKQLLAEVDMHYSKDNIVKRNQWMKKVDDTMIWVNDRAEIYDSSIEKITTSLNTATEALSACTSMTEEMFVENSRDRIIDFAEKVADPEYLVSHEQFRRIFKIHNKYEAFLQAHNRSNGQVDRSFEIINEAYEYRLRHKLFIEDINRYKDKK